MSVQNLTSVPAEDPEHLTPEAHFREQLAQGRIVLQRPRGGGETFFYPRVLQPGTGSTDLEWVEVSGKATVYSTTVVRRLEERGGNYNIALVDFAEGGRMMTRVVGINPEDVRIGMIVSLFIEKENNEHVLLCKPQRGD